MLILFATAFSFAYNSRISMIGIVVTNVRKLKFYIHLDISKYTFEV